MTIREIFYSIKEMFNAFLDTDLIEILIIVGGLGFILWWSGMIFFTFKEVLPKVEDWWDQKNPFENKTREDEERGSFLLALLLFFPSLVFALIPLMVLFFLGVMIWISPLLLFDWYIR